MTTMLREQRTALVDVLPMLQFLLSLGIGLLIQYLRKTVYNVENLNEATETRQDFVIVLQETFTE